jgi:glycosyltransferase involved in cell wall biosynthesis
MENARVALVHDWLTGLRGGEKVLEVLAEIFPRAVIHTLLHIPGSQPEAIENLEIRTAFIQRLPFVRKKYRSYLPLFPLAVELFDLQEFDLVVSSSHCVAKGAIPRPDALHVSYVHSPVRYAWNQYAAYFSSARLSPFGRWTIPPVIHYLRLWDVASSARVDHFAANSANVARRIEKYYRRPAEVVHPPVDTEFFTPDENGRKEDYDLIVSALVPYKRLDLAVAAYNKLGRKLVVVGTGPESRRLRKAARSNIVFVDRVDDVELRRLYREARAFLLPGEEDFGIAVLEAQACGTPVVALGRGGALETVVPGQTGLLFNEASVAGLLRVLDKFDGFAFNKAAARSNAMKFSRQVFKEKMSGFLRAKWKAAGFADR